MRKLRNQASVSRTPIASNLLARMDRKRILGDPRLSTPGTVHETPETLQATVAGIREFEGLHPAHAAYVYAHNVVSSLAEKVTSWVEMKPFVKIIARAEDLYMPSSPPMSPLTTSYFSCWSFFDACAGPANETIGSVLLEFCWYFDIGNELSRLIRIMQGSRMGFYVNRGRQGDLLILEELVTGAVCTAMVPAGDFGKSGELWYVRVLPPPFGGGSAHVLFTTPYIVLTPDSSEWPAYFSRALPKQHGIEDYERHMKFGPTRNYWNDFVFEGYVNYKAGAVYLAGVPDIPASRPHSAVNQSFDGIDLPQ
jgi:hypothetical protein